MKGEMFQTVELLKREIHDIQKSFICKPRYSNKNVIPARTQALTHTHAHRTARAREHMFT